jgi:hypothetical protein
VSKPQPIIQWQQEISRSSSAPEEPFKHSPIHKATTVKTPVLTQPRPSAVAEAAELPPIRTATEDPEDRAAEPPTETQGKRPEMEQMAKETTVEITDVIHPPEEEVEPDPSAVQVFAVLQGAAMAVKVS